MEDREHRIIIRWRTRGQVEALAPTLERIYPADQSPCFGDALEAIDEAERRVWNDGDPDSPSDN